MRYNKLAGAVLAGAIALTGGFEGYKHYAYQDPVGVWTACFGETAGIKPGDMFTREQCELMLSSSLDKHNGPIAKIPQKLPARVHLAALDMAYNIGTGAFGQSTMYRYLLNADYLNACNQIPRWRFAKGRDCAIKSNNCYGIVNRRAIVHQLCLGNIDINEALGKIGQMPLDKEILGQLDD
ncbi:hypothetical protein EQ875_01649 [Photobacterium damselae subsp. damselae]|uniref:lysozyme n=1 Tax=Photobacterium damselae TaxID=38293 RepID=UPI00109B8926|nr:lysozyme [Photobacterium damselae]TGZ35368.1 hypothetical protein EQ875_01649 [Photobacterium damselae subsp. damselae]